MDIDNRPTKRRKFFFAENPEDDGGDVTLPNVESSRPQSATSSAEKDTLSETEHNDLQPANDPISKDKFDVDTFCAFVGEQVDRDVVQKIQDASNGNIERAVNMYFDGSWKANMPARNIQNQASGITSWMSRPSTSVKHSPSKSEDKPTVPVTLKHMASERYIGSFGVEAWSTKSGTNLIRPGEVVNIERTRLAPKTKLGRGGKPVTVVNRYQKADVITRFTNSRGEEVGRLPEETARWVSPLLDQKICRLQGTCVYAEERLRVNDTVFLQIQAFMLKSAFESSNFVKPSDDNRETGFFLEKESTEEKDLRLRQVALVKLFDEINLLPTTTNSKTAKHKKQGLLRAAEMAEQYDKEKSNKPKLSDTSASPEEEEDGEELEDDQLDMLYQKAQQFDFNMPEAQPASTFALELRKYQKQALHWMLNKEQDETSKKSTSMHPLWEEYTWPTKDANDAPLPTIEDQDKFYVNLYSGEISLDFPVQEQNCLGGILADEMGLGKTIEMFSLIHTNKSEEAMAATAKNVTSVNRLPRLPQSSNSVVPAPCTTLVVAPMSLLAQWDSEAMKSSLPGSMKTLVYYGSEKGTNLQTLCSVSNAASAPNVIITSYGVVLSEFNQIAAAGGDQGSHGGLFSVDFFRIILDEAHTIKNRQAKTSKACYELKAKHRWVLTGTPIVNRLEDLFSLVRFLKVEPWSNFSFWKTFITVPFEAKDFIRALNVVQTVLEPLVLRRTKDMKTPEGEALVPLPPREIKIEEVELSKTEREVYDLIFTRAKRAFNESIAAGTLLKSYTTIFAQILRLRQSCCHPVLTRNKDVVADEEEAAAAAAASDVNGLADDVDLQDLIERFTNDAKAAEKEAKDPINTFTTHALKQIQTESSGECPMCSEEPMINPVVTTCWHTSCRNCLEAYIKHETDKGEKPRCPVCRETINPRDIFEVVKYGGSSDNNTPVPENNDDEDAEETTEMYSSSPVHPPPNAQTPVPRISLRRLHPYSPTSSTSAKIAALLRHLTSLPITTKSVVFSQFTSFLDLIAPQLTRHNISHLRLDGTMNQKMRTQVLRSFTSEDTTSSSPRVLLLSLRAGGVGLNLTAASRCYMMDPWWSFAVEAQAIDRVHRMGQTERVEVVRFIVKESIEGRMLSVQERKMAVAGTLGVGHGSGGGGSIEDLQTLLG
ncbi:DNA helicase rad5 [Neophaeococcomyces mojaviensis]|uniref:DNA helicase rad5 n=1 Tax=Neophaeococcomyces mojaviensis TaxID=3383035 RepID=A0ACC2ZSP5_9EURO|nr:DNA helicase rad5 [Knufia sp. JES_112]